MTAHKSFKRLVRARMATTGESYTAARAQLLAGDDGTRDDRSAGSDVPTLVCSDERIRERTGRGWEAWFDVLDSWGAESMAHTQLTRRVGELLDVHPLAWDAQAVVTSFERTRGLRAVGERVGGDGFVAGASKTIAVSPPEVFAAFVDPSRRAGWLPGVVLSERTVSKPRSARFDVGDGPSRLVVTVHDKGPERSTVVVEQSRLSGPQEREAQKAFWRHALATLKAGGEVRGTRVP